MQTLVDLQIFLHGTSTVASDDLVIFFSDGMAGSCASDADVGADICQGPRADRKHTS
jgi:hypothetical protein